jgi:hypothetical protein
MAERMACPPEVRSDDSPCSIQDEGQMISGGLLLASLEKLLVRMEHILGWCLKQRAGSSPTPFLQSFRLSGGLGQVIPNAENQPRPMCIMLVLLFT